MIHLTTEIKQLITDDTILFLKSCEVLTVKQATLNKYLKENNTSLTELNFLNHLVEYTQLPLSQVITNGKLSKLMCK